MKLEGPFAPGRTMRGEIVPTQVDPAVAEKQRPHAGMPFEIKVETMEPERVFSFRWHPFAIDRQVDYREEPTTLVTFRLEPVADGVLLTVTESGFDRIPLERRAKAFTANSEGWSLVVRLLEKHLAHAL
jgi:hypothetical protein